MDSDSLYVFSSHISLDSTLPLTHADVLAHKANSVQGCVLHSRDLIELVDKIDPLGEAEYRHEMRWRNGHAEQLNECTDPNHQGRRDLPEMAFRVGDNICLRCRMRDEGTQPKAPGVKPKRGKFMKAFRPRKFQQHASA